MSYRELFDACQTLPLHVSRGPVRKALCDITGITLRIVHTSLDVRVCRGMYLSPQNMTHKIVQQVGGAHVVVLPREGNNYCWQRFVEVKEYMHVFDSLEEATDTGEEFDRLIGEFAAAGGLAISAGMTGEIKAYWRALGVLCPEHVRQELIQEKADRGTDMTDYAIAYRLRIPEQYVPSLFEDWYIENQQRIFD